MRLALTVAIVALTAGLSARAAVNHAKEFKPLMKAAARADGRLKSALKEEDSAAARTAAEDLSRSMAEIADFRSGRGAADAAEWSASVKRAADEIGTKADAGDFAAAQSVWEGARESCDACPAR